MFIKLIISFIFATSLSLFSDDHSEEQSLQIPGMDISSDVFDTILILSQDMNPIT